MRYITLIWSTAIALVILGMVMAFAADAPAPAAPDASCAVDKTIQTFKDEVAKQPQIHFIILEGKDLDVFTAAFDKLNNIQHSPDLSALVFLDPSEQKSDVIIQMAIFKQGCFVGLVPVPAGMLNASLGQRS